jgi:hypothetical protein
MFRNTSRTLTWNISFYITTGHLHSKVYFGKSADFYDSVGQLTLSMVLGRAEVRSYVQRATIPGKRVVYTLNCLQNTTHAIINNTCLIHTVKYIFSFAG